MNDKSHYCELLLIFFFLFYLLFPFVFFSWFFSSHLLLIPFIFSPSPWLTRFFLIICQFFFHMKLIPAKSIISAGIAWNGQNTPEWPKIYSGTRGVYHSDLLAGTIFSAHSSRKGTKLITLIFTSLNFAIIFCKLVGA